MIQTRTLDLPTASGTKTATVSQLPATRAVRLLAKTGKLLGPGVGKLGSLLAASRPDKLGEMQLEQLAPALGALLSALDPDELEAFLLELFSGVKLGTADLTKQLFDVEFCGNLASVWKLALFCLEVQFGNFFGDIVARAAAVAAAKAASSATSTTSSGPSTG